MRSAMLDLILLLFVMASQFAEAWAPAQTTPDANESRAARMLGCRAKNLT